MKEKPQVTSTTSPVRTATRLILDSKRSWVKWSLRRRKLSDASRPRGEGEGQVATFACDALMLVEAGGTRSTSATGAEMEDAKERADVVDNAQGAR